MTGKIVIIGAINMDVWGLSEYGVQMADSNPGIVRTSPGGVGRNIAHNLCLLGEETELLTAISDDFWGRALEENCREIGIGLSLAVRPRNARTGTYLYITGPDRDLLVGVCDTEISTHLDAASIRERISAINEASAVVIDGNLTEETLLYIGAHVTAPIFADPVSKRKAEKLLPILNRIHTMKPNRLEAEALTGEKEPEAAAKALREKGVKNVYISLGSEGMYVSTADFEGRLPALKAAVKNTTGAGDAAMSGIIKGYILGLGGHHTARFSMACGAIAAEAEETISPVLSQKAAESRC